MMARDKKVVIALGNRFRGDDAIGPTVADLLVGRLDNCAILEGQDDAMAILNAWEGAELAVVVDAASSDAPVGTIHRLDNFTMTVAKDLARCSSHGVGLVEAIELSKALGCLPAQLVIYAVEAKSFETGAPLSPEVEEVAGAVVRQIVAEVMSSALPEEASHA
ncbi:hydrogenase maturation protease [candidate division KSB1 bacterium]|nr:hydrogenase maturation protease [Phycisphaerae bacterium]NIP51076.1 hydrogenase maturation protease [Phycisphaerae bacterium]NIV92130.1 hydrogenase maturation protease [candidate division KSB1 bacterium]NIX31938.1 hydrogenase maturation protease [Phycisphaerae bacterium]